MQRGLVFQGRGAERVKGVGEDHPGGDGGAEALGVEAAWKKRLEEILGV